MFEDGCGLSYQGLLYAEIASSFACKQQVVFEVLHGMGVESVERETQHDVQAHHKNRVLGFKKMRHLVGTDL